MVKEDIVVNIAADTGYQRGMVKNVVDALLEHITWALASGNEVRFAGFGVFKPKTRAARVGRNPHTGEAVPIPARVVPSFEPGEVLKRATIKNI